MTWAVAAIAFGLLMLCVEIFITSGGLFVVLGLFAMASGVIIIFITPISEGGGPLVGTLTLAGIGLVLAIFSYWFMYLWPRTRMGKEFFLDSPDDQSSTDEESGSDIGVRKLIGQVGKTVTPHQPSGATEIGGRRHDSMSEGLFLDSGQFVKVIGVQGQVLIVRSITQQEYSDLPFDINA